METHEDDAVYRESRKFAADVILEICARSQIEVATSKGPVPVASMTTSRTFIENLMKVAMFSGNMHSFSDFSSEGKPWKGVPVSLLGTFFIYSLKVAPVNERGDIDQKQLAEAVFEMETVFGNIPVDPMILAEICSPSASPVRSANPGGEDLEDFYG